MHELIAQFGGYLSVAWRNRWVALAVAWIICVGGWIAVERIPDSYKSDSTVFVDTDSMVRNSMRGIASEFQGDLQAKLNFFRQSLLSRPNLEEVMRRADLDVQARTAIEREQILNQLQARLSVSSKRENNVYDIAYTSRNPELAHAVVQAVLAIFMESNLGANREELETTQSFLSRQIEEREAEIARLQQTLRQFEITNRDFLSGDNNFEAQLRDAQNSLFTLEGQKVQAEANKENLERDLEDIIGKIRAGEVLDTALADRVRELEESLNNLLSGYTHEHPDVIITKNLLERERERLQTIAEEGRSGAEINNPIVNELRSGIREEDARVRMMDGQVESLHARIADLESKVARIPPIAAERERMTRNLNVAQSNLAKLIERREQARFAQRLDVESSIVEFRVIEPPTQPFSPTGPNRMLMRSGVFVGGLGVGGALAVGLGVFMGTFSSRSQLMRAVGRPVIGAVRRTILPQWRTRMLVESAAFWGMAAFLAAVFGGVSIGLLEGMRNSTVIGI